MSEPQDPNDQQPPSEQTPSEPASTEQPSAQQPPSSEPPSSEPLSMDKQPAAPASDTPPPPGQQYGAPPPGQQYGAPPPGQQYGAPPPGQQYGAPPSGPQYGAPPPGPPYGYPSAPVYSQPPPRDPQGRILDPASGLYLPPGVELASHGRRIGAYFLSILLVIVTLVIGWVIWGLIVWNRGTTPALQVLGMKCYRVDNGEVPTWWRMVLREVVGGIIDGILGVITQLASFILFLTTGKRQALHDLIATTTVVYDPNKILG